MRGEETDYMQRVALGIILAFASIAQFKKTGENPDVGHPTSNLISSGPYAFSRNPLYISIGMLQAGISFLFNSWWGLITLIPVVLLQQAWVILPEEKYLEQKLGGAYIEYKQQVRRWI